MDNDQSSSLMSATGVGGIPHKNHNIRNLNGFCKTTQRWAQRKKYRTDESSFSGKTKPCF